MNALNKNNSKPSSSGLKRPDPIFITDTVYNPSITTYDDYYSEFFNINQQNAKKRNPDKVYANTESSVAETGGYGKPHKTGPKGAQKPTVQNTDTSYNTQSNTDYVKPSDQNSYSNSNQGSGHVQVIQGSKKKTNEEPEYVPPKPQQTYTDSDSYPRPQSNTDEYGNYNPRPQTTATNYNRPQVNSDTNFNARPQSNSEINYNARPQATYENNFDTNSRPQSSATNGFGTGSSSANNYNGASNQDTNNYNPKRPTTYVESYRPQANSEGGYVPQSNSGSSYQNTGSSYNPNTGYSGSQATVNNGYSTVNSNSRPNGNAGKYLSAIAEEMTKFKKLYFEG